jgi:hypothetical protein
MLWLSQIMRGLLRVMSGGLGTPPVANILVVSHRGTHGPGAVAVVGWGSCVWVLASCLGSGLLCVAPRESEMLSLVRGVVLVA